MSGLLRILVPRRRSPAVLMQSLNETLLERKVDAQYATLLVALWEPCQRKLTLCNAGAEPPLILRKGRDHQAQSGRRADRVAGGSAL